MTGSKDYSWDEEVLADWGVEANYEGDRKVSLSVRDSLDNDRALITDNQDLMADPTANDNSLGGLALSALSPYDKDLKSVMQYIFKLLEDPNTKECDVPVFVGFDCEEAHTHVTEVGVSTFDPLQGRHMGGISSAKCISAVHGELYRIQEKSRIMLRFNDRRGASLWAADSFQFGTSTWVNEEDIVHVISSIINAALTASNNQQRPLVVVAHAWNNDSAYLAKLGFDIESTLPLSLVDLINHCNIDALKRHNGGNDVVYTMAVLILIFLEGEKKDGMNVLDEPTIDGTAAFKALRKAANTNTNSSLTRLITCNNCGIPGHDAHECRKVCSVCREFDHGRDTCTRLIRPVVRPICEDVPTFAQATQKNVNQVKNAKKVELEGEAEEKVVVKSARKKKSAWASLKF
ncbi:hypothetical protein EJ08DRAFT_699656 [Tothia fuscella]|uniref:CCHC-type domain-containing protein n=1 Tax=Tothia fuscella TaxID=1048955 RepID=A0A9P4NMT1_9PEZI|nr:hypothetical protein EJ08DRAFT_699656 [Tothia fuscella]